MKIEATCNNFDAIIKEELNSGSGLASTMGIMLMVILVGDAYLNATGAPSLSSFLCFSFFQKDFRELDHGKFWFLILNQILGLILAWLIIQRSTWRNLFSKEILKVFKIHELRKNYKNSIYNYLANWRICLFILTTIFSWEFVSSLTSVISFLSSTTYIIVLVNIVISISFALVLTVLLASCCHDRATLIGLVLGLVVLVVGWAYAPRELLSDNNYTNLSNDSSFNNWQFGFICAVIIFILSSVIKDKTVIHLRLSKSSTVPSPNDSTSSASFTKPMRFSKDGYMPFWNYNTSGVKFTKLIYVQFNTQGDKIIVMTKSEDDEKYALVNTINEHNITLLDRNAFRIWNISILENQINETLERFDRGGYFALKSNVSLMTSTAPYFDKKGNNQFDPIAVTLATDIIFNNGGLKQIIQRAIERVFDNEVKNSRESVGKILSIIDDAKIAMAIEDGSIKNGQYEENGQEFSSVNRLNKRKIAQEKMVVIQRVERVFKALRSRIYEFVGDDKICSLVNNEILREFDKMVLETGIDESKKEEAVKVVNLLGIRLSGLEVRLIGDAADCAAKLKDIRQELEKRLQEADEKVEQQLNQSDQRKGELIQAILNRPDIRPEVAETAIKTLLMNKDKAAASSQIEEIEKIIDVENEEFET